jgi:hypothetical protein
VPSGAAPAPSGAAPAPGSATPAASGESSEQADAQGATAGAPPPDEVWSFGRFGDISVYRPKGEPRDVALFASGDGGWNLGVVSMARRLAAENTLVASSSSPPTRASRPRPTSRT